MQILKTDLHTYLIKLVERIVKRSKHFPFCDHFMNSKNIFSSWVFIDIVQGENWCCSLLGLLRVKRSLKRWGITYHLRHQDLYMLGFLFDLSTNHCLLWDASPDKSLWLLFSLSWRKNIVIFVKNQYNHGRISNKATNANSLPHKWN